MAFDAGAVVAHIKADISDFESGIKKAQREADTFGSRMKGLASGVADFANKAAIVSGVVGAGVTLFLKDASQEAANFEKAMISLDIIANRFDVSGKKAQQSAQALGKELRIGTGAAAEGLQNLLKSGLNLEQATDLMKRFTNEAITGKSANISLSQAVQNLSFAYATQNSALGNMSGVSENFEDIIKRGRDSLIKQGKAASEVTDEMAKYQGMIELTNLTMGSSQRFSGTFIDTQAQLEQKILELKIAIGQGLNPILNEFLGLIIKSGILDALKMFGVYMQAIIASFSYPVALDELFPPQIVKLIEFFVQQLKLLAAWVQENQALVMTFLQGLAIGLGALLIIGTIAGLIALVTNPLFLLIAVITALYVAWQTNFYGIRDITTAVFEFLKPYILASLNVIIGFWRLFHSIIDGLNKLLMALLKGDWSAALNAIKQMILNSWDAIKQIFTGMLGFFAEWGSRVLDGLTKPFREAWEKISEYVKKIRDALDFTKKHSPSVVDIVERGVGLVNKALDGLNLSVSGMHPSISPSVLPSASGNLQSNNINIDMSGAVISDEASAMRMGEKIGDSILKKLNLNVRY